jgi:hypothetical protein
MNMHIKLLIFVIVPIVGIQGVFAEEYYYIPNYRLEQLPIFCAMGFEDIHLPGASDKLIKVTQDSVFEWRDKLQAYTGNKEGWDFRFKHISLQDQKNNPFHDWDCNVKIFFERPNNDQQYAGYADAFNYFTDITIFYLEPIYGNKVKQLEYDGRILDILVPEGFNNKLDERVDETIKHEIGHALGLDHFPLPSNQIKSVSEIPYSIMVEPIFYPTDTTFEITDYDVRAVVNLYGTEGIMGQSWFWILDYLLVGIIVAVVILVIRVLKNTT